MRRRDEWDWGMAVVIVVALVLGAAAVAYRASVCVGADRPWWC